MGSDVFITSSLKQQTPHTTEVYHGPTQGSTVGKVDAAGRETDTWSANNFLKAAVLYFNIWGGSHNYLLLSARGLRSGYRGVTLYLSTDTSTPSSCFAFSFSIKPALPSFLQRQ